MTVETNDTVERYTISGVGPYAFSFRIFDDEDLTVSVINADLVTTGLTLSSHYSVTGANDEDGGSITLTAPAASTYASSTLDIRSNTVEYQPTSIRNQGRFLPEIHEDAFDRMVRQVQDLARKVRSALRYPDDGTADAVTPSVASRKGRYLFANTVTGLFEWVTSIATTALSQSIFNQYQADSDPYKRTAAEIAAGVTVVNYAYPPFNLLRYGNNTTPGATDMTAALLAAVTACHPYATDSAPVFQGGEIYIPPGKYLMDGATVALLAHIRIRGDLDYIGGAENGNYGPQIIRTVDTPLLRLYACNTVQGIDFTNEVVGGIDTPWIEVWDLDNHILQCRFSGSTIGVKLIAIPVGGKTGTALIEQNFFGYLYAGSNAAAIVFDSTNGAINPMTVRDNFLHVNTAVGYTGTVGIHTFGSFGLENVLIYGNNLQGYTSANCIGFNVYGVALKIFGNTLAGFTDATAIGINIPSATPSNDVSIDDNFFFGVRTAIKTVGLINSRIGPQYYSGVTTNTNIDATSQIDNFGDQGVAWTPGISFGGGTTGITYGAQFGRYTKVRNIVTVMGRVTLTNKGSSTGVMRVTGLPFPIVGTTDALAAGGPLTSYSNMAGLVGHPVVQGEIGTTTLVVHGDSATDIVNLSESSCTNTTSIDFVATYRTY